MNYNLPPVCSFVHNLLQCYNPGHQVSSPSCNGHADVFRTLVLPHTPAHRWWYLYSSGRLGSTPTGCYRYTELFGSRHPDSRTPYRIFVHPGSIDTGCWIHFFRCMCRCCDMHSGSLTRYHRPGHQVSIYMLVQKNRGGMWLKPEIPLNVRW